MRLQSQRRGFLGMNVRGTPAMPPAAVRHDLGVALNGAGVIALQEFRHRRYWRELRKATKRHPARWRTFPALPVAILRPVFAGQPLVWRADQWRVQGRRRRLLHSGSAGISEDRHIRAVLLEERRSGIPCWFATTHYVVGGDNPGDGSRRRLLLAQDVTVTDELLTDLRKTGHPIILQLDANIRLGSGAWTAFRRMIRSHGGTFVGHLGVEFMIVFQGTGAGAGVLVVNDWIVPTSRLRTDHEARGITIRLEAGGTA